MIARQQAGRESGSLATSRYMESSLSDVFGEKYLCRLRETLALALERSNQIFRSPMLDPAVKSILAECCAHARGVGLRPEHFVILLKKIWKELPEAHRVENVREQDVLACIISTCIKEYFAFQPDPGRTSL